MNAYIAIAIALMIFCVISVVVGIHPSVALVAALISMFSALWGFGKMEEEGKL